MPHVPGLHVRSRRKRVLPTDERFCRQADMAPGQAGLRNRWRASVHWKHREKESDRPRLHHDQQYVLLIVLFSC